MPKTFFDKQYCPWCGGALQRRNHHFTCESCGVNDYDTPRAAVGILVFNNVGEVLLARRAFDPGKGRLDFPGGFIDAEETAQQAAARELYEETGLQVNTQDLQLVDVIPHSYLYQDILYPLTVLLFAAHTSQSIKVVAADDVASLQWMQPKTIDFADFAWPEQAACIKAYLHAQNML